MWEGIFSPNWFSSPVGEDQILGKLKLSLSSAMQDIKAGWVLLRFSTLLLNISTWQQEQILEICTQGMEESYESHIERKKRKLWEENVSYFPKSKNLIFQFLR